MKLLDDIENVVRELDPNEHAGGWRTCDPKNEHYGEINHIHKTVQTTCYFYVVKKIYDITLIIEGEKIYTHKFILASRSKYFEALIYGGLKESTQSEIELKGAQLESFKVILDYMYIGFLLLEGRTDEELVNIICTAHLYGFVDLIEAVSKYLPSILTVENICTIIETSQLYDMERLTEACNRFCDENACEIIKRDEFLRLSASTVRELIGRDSFCAPELDIFLAVKEWSEANPKGEVNDLFGLVRLCLIRKKDLERIVAPSELVSTNKISQSIAIGTLLPEEIPYREGIIIDKNVATYRLKASVVKLGVGNHTLYSHIPNLNRETYDIHYVKVAVNDSTVIKLGRPYLINHIKFLLLDRNKDFSYYVELSLDFVDWVRVIDYSNYICTNWQNLYFPPKRAQYIKIVGETTTMGKYFFILGFECSYASEYQDMLANCIIPKTNIATVKNYTSIVDNLYKYRNEIIDKNITKYLNDSYISKYIMIRFCQPFIIESLRFLLNEKNNQTYSYYIQVSGNGKKWIRIVDKSEEECTSWQTINISQPEPLVFICIVSARKTGLDIIHLECPIEYESSGSDPFDPEGYTFEVSDSDETDSYTSEMEIDMLQSDPKPSTSEAPDQECSISDLITEFISK